MSTEEKEWSQFDHVDTDKEGLFTSQKIHVYVNAIALERFRRDPKENPLEYYDFTLSYNPDFYDQSKILCGSVDFDMSLPTPEEAVQLECEVLDKAIDDQRKCHNSTMNFLEARKNEILKLTYIPVGEQQ